MPLGRFISPIEIALYIEYYFNSDVKNLTGSEFVIDGGEIFEKKLFNNWWKWVFREKYCNFFLKINLKFFV